MEVLAESTAKAIINCPVDKINLTEWLFTLKDHEYQACSSGHIACGASFSEEGKRISVNVEKVADNYLVQHYIEEIGERNHCRVKSLSDSISALGSTKLGIIWELKVEDLSEESCEFSNYVQVVATPEFISLLKSVNITDLTAVKSQMLFNLEAHNKEETPLFADDIQRKVLKDYWI